MALGARSACEGPYLGGSCWPSTATTTAWYAVGLCNTSPKVVLGPATADTARVLTKAPPDMLVLGSAVRGSPHEARAYQMAFVIACHNTHMLLTCQCKEGQAAPAVDQARSLLQ